MKVLITGGAGFIGSTVVKLALTQDHTVINFDALTYAANLESLASVSKHPGYSFEHVDIRDQIALERVFQEHAPNAVIHLTAESHGDRSIDEPSAFLETNVVGTYNLLTAARKHGLTHGSPDDFRFLHVSTDEVFGSLDPEGRFHESTAYARRSPYSSTKAASDHLARAWYATYDLPIIMTNCSNTYGPFQYPEKLIPLTILKLVAGKRVPVYGTGENIRDWLHVQDHATALLTVLRSGQPGETYNIGSENEVRNIDLVRTICTKFDTLYPYAAPHSDLIDFVADRPDHDERYATYPSELQRDLGWHPEISFADEVSSVVDWYLDNPDWCQPLQNQTDLGARLGTLAT